MSEKFFKTTEPQSYSFEFGSDGRIYTVSFKGNLQKEDERKILEAAGKHTYGKAGRAIRSYLEYSHLKYSDFESRETVLKHETIMEWADTLLHTNACNTIDARIGNAAHYYAVMDHQKWVREDLCEGCYYAMKRCITQNPFETYYRHYVIGQTFIFDKTEDESSYFAIRRNDGHPKFYNLCLSKGSPVLPAFGCVDLIGLLRNIERVNHAGQAKDIAINFPLDISPFLY